MTVSADFIRVHTASYQFGDLLKMTCQTEIHDGRDERMLSGIIGMYFAACIDNTFGACNDIAAHVVIEYDKIDNLCIDGSSWVNSEHEELSAKKRKLWESLVVAAREYVEVSDRCRKHVNDTLDQSDDED